MKRGKVWVEAVGCCALLAVAGAAHGGFVEFLDDREGWLDAAGRFTTIDFVGFPKNTILTDQYIEQGLLFTDGNDRIDSGGAYVNDLWGVDGNGDVNVVFETPQLWIAVDFPGVMAFQLFRDGELVYTSTFWTPGGLDHFFGIVSSEPFDAVRIIDPLGEAAIDDLHFGVPAPGAFWVLGLGVIGRGRRSRRVAPHSTVDTRVSGLPSGSRRGTPKPARLSTLPP